MKSLKVPLSFNFERNFVDILKISRYLSKVFLKKKPNGINKTPHNATSSTLMVEYQASCSSFHNSFMDTGTAVTREVSAKS